MKFIRIILLVFLYFICIFDASFAQKKNIDSNAYAKWASLGYANINSNGKYVYYSIENEPVGSKTSVVQSTKTSWKRSIEGANDIHFLSAQGLDYAIVLINDDSLGIISLGRNLVQKVPNVSSFSVPKNGESEWVAYQLKQPGKKLIIQNVITGKKYTYSNVINQIMGNDGQTIILQTEKNVDNKAFQQLSWVDLNTGKSTLICEGLKARRIVLDIKHHQLAFVCEKGLLSYNIQTQKLNCLIDNKITSLDSGLKLGGIKQFSNDGNRLFIELKEEDKQKPKPGFVEVWSYLDTKLQPQQENEITAKTYAAIVNLNDGKIIRLEKEFENLSVNSFENGSSDTIRILTRNGKGKGNADLTVFELISLKSGKRIPLKYPPEGLSPSGKYVVCLDPGHHTYVCYDTKTGRYQTISKAFSENNTEQNFGRSGVGIAGWLGNDEGVLFYDNYDIWRMDLTGKEAPVNLTAGFGEKYHLVFSILFQCYSFPLEKTQKITLSAFDLESKKNGFYSLKLDKVNKPEILSMGDYNYSTPSLSTIYFGGAVPTKAGKAEVYIVNRMSVKESLNNFITRDFKTFKPLSNIHPEHDYNWYTSELHTWTSLDGKKLQGILYKPENFDPNKRYPVIFGYYEGKSNNLNVYIKPNTLCQGCEIDIPTYVSNGYLIFTPDIVYKIGDPMQGTYDAVVSAAKYISALPFVNSTKMGIQGCSWGGYQTNYLVTHTNLFAAACTASGIADWIANYGRLRGGSPLYGNGQTRMEKSIWEIQEAYIKTSAIFQLDKVTTPFLIMHTKNDQVCSFDDAIELFVGLRQLGKRSWLLAYPNEDHGIFDKRRASDFSTRMMQFFDHYLKDKPAPLWMTHGIPAEKRGLDDGLAYDTKIKTPGPGLLTPDEQRKVDSLMTRKPILIELK